MKIKTLLYAVLLAVLSGAVVADDLEVYGSNQGSSTLPNVLFILDYSGSMDKGTDNLDTSVYNDKKIVIMRNVFKSVLADSAGKINVGLIQFEQETSGVKWPVSDLAAQANSIDPNVQAGVTVEQVLGSIVDNKWPWGYTATVDSLYEAALYFRGDDVWRYGSTWPADNEPSEWSQANNRFESGNSRAAHPATYLPHNAFLTGGSRVNNSDAMTQITGCWNAQPYDPNAADNCSGHESVPNSCVHYPSKTYTPSPYCPQAQVCSQYFEGVCQNWYCPVALVQGPNQVSPEHLICEYYYGSWISPTYISPIGASCQKNYIILLSDGLPTINGAAQNIQEMIGGGSCQAYGNSIFNDPSEDKGDCAPELLEYLNTNDQIPGLAPSRITTYTVGFGLTGDKAVIGNKYLTLLANSGGGSYFPATDETALKLALTSIIDSISGGVEDYSGFSIGVNSNSFSNDNKAFINLFSPSSSRSWTGNIKGYFIDKDGLKDVNGLDAVDAEGQFLVGSQSFWSSSADGESVGGGGFSEKMQNETRHLLTYTSSTAANNALLTDTAHALSSSNTNLTPSLFGLSNTTQRDELITWLETAAMKDPLHSKPATVKYAGKTVLYTTNNLGFLHAIDVTHPTAEGDLAGGDEIFSFIPQELLKNLPDIRSNLATGSHIYGLDGEMSIWHNDINKDGVVNGSDKVILYTGMRRGGRNYYAIDITVPESPKLKWVIKGGEGSFKNLAQTWSRMVLATINWGGSTKKVLIFGGGYDVAEDSKTSRSASSYGSRVYMIDAQVGNLLWSTGSGTRENAGVDIAASGMQYSIPANLAVVDADADGFADHIYFGDMGGQIWRIKADDHSTGFSSGVTVDKVADFGSVARRQFFYSPAVALMTEYGEKYLAITIASGNRAHPLATGVQDRVYMVRDPYITPLTSTVSETDLYDATDNLVGEGTSQTVEKGKLKAAKGWYMDLKSNEKSLSQVTVFNNILRFTTYQPIDISMSADQCSISSNSINRYYSMNLKNATPHSDSGDVTTPLDKSDREAYLESSGGIPSSPLLVFPEGSDEVQVYVGRENAGNLPSTLHKAYWKKLR